MHFLAVLGDDPVLSLHIPVGEITTVKSRGPDLLLPRSQEDSVELAQNDPRLIRSAQGNILEASQPKMQGKEQVSHSPIEELHNRRRCLCW